MILLWHLSFFFIIYINYYFLSLNNKMSELTFSIIKQAFKGQSVTEKDYLTSEQLFHIVSKLNAADFDEETYEEIWDQCKLNSKGEVRISDFIQVLLKGEQLLIEKQQQNTNEIARLDNEKKGKLTDLADQHKYKEQVDALLEEREGVKNSLAIIRKPFIVTLDPIKTGNPENILAENAGALQIQQDDIIRQMFEYDSSQTAGILLIIFYITGTLLLFGWLSSMFICQFLSMMAYTLILSQFYFQIISRKIIKFNLIMLGGCCFFDVLWLILQTGNIWYLPVNYQLPAMASSYLKFSIIIIISCLCLRMVVIYYYLSQFHLDQFQVYSIKVFGKELSIQREPQPYTANKNALSYLLQPFFNKAVLQAEQIQ